MLQDWGEHSKYSNKYIPFRISNKVFAEQPHKISLISLTLSYQNLPFLAANISGELSG